MNRKTSALLLAVFTFGVNPSAFAERCSDIQDRIFKASIEIQYGLESQSIARQQCRMSGKSQCERDDMELGVENDMLQDARASKWDAKEQFSEAGCGSIDYGEAMSSYKSKHKARIEKAQEDKWMRLKGY